MNLREIFGWYLIIGGVLIVFLTALGYGAFITIQCILGTACTGGFGSLPNSILLVVSLPSFILANFIFVIFAWTIGNVIGGLISIVAGYFLIKRRVRR